MIMQELNFTTEFHAFVNTTTPIPKDYSLKNIIQDFADQMDRIW